VSSKISETLDASNKRLDPGAARGDHHCAAVIYVPPSYRNWRGGQRKQYARPRHRGSGDRHSLPQNFGGSAHAVLKRSTVITRIRTDDGLVSEVYNGDNREHGR
jgi:hypothetical protein